MEVREVPDANAVERLGEAVDRHLEHPVTEPAGLDPRVAGDYEGTDSEQHNDEHLGTLETDADSPRPVDQTALSCSSATERCGPDRRSRPRTKAFPWAG